MSFKTRQSTFRFDRAPTSRARCRRCKTAVASGELRCHITAFVCPGRAHAFVRCMPCVGRDAAFVAAVLAAHDGRADAVPLGADLTDAERQRVRRVILQEPHAPLSP